MALFNKEIPIEFYARISFTQALKDVILEVLVFIFYNIYFLNINLLLIVYIYNLFTSLKLL